MDRKGMQYYGTDLDQAGHYLWELEGNGIYSSRLRFGDLPFNPEGLPHREDNNSISNGTVKWYHFAGFTICAIQGSCKDSRGGSKSIFFIKQENVSQTQMKDKILSIPVAKKIIEKMPFEVKW